MTFIFKSRALLQIAIAVAACVPVFAGGYGIFYDAEIGGIQPVLSYNHIHYLSGLLLAIGLAFWACIPSIERRTTEVRLLTMLVFIGGLARFYGVIMHNEFSPSIAFALIMELVITPLICLWQSKIKINN